MKSKIFKILVIARKTVLRILFSLFLLVYVLVALLNSTIVQSITAAKVADYFSEQWNTRFTIGALEIRPLLNVALKDVYLEDLKHDTIANISYVSAGLSSFTPSKQLAFSDVVLSDVDFNLKIENRKLNFAFIIDYFKSDKPKKDKPKSRFAVKVKNCKMKDVNFSLDLNDNPKPVPEFGVAVNHMKYSDINATIKDIEVISDSVSVNISKFSLMERSGFKLKELRGRVIASPKRILCEGLHIQTDNSDLYMQAHIKTDSWKTYSSFVDSAYCMLFVRSGSKVGMKDATYWAPVLKGFNQTFYLHTAIEGKVADAECSVLDIRTSDTRLEARGRIKGLPDMENTMFDLTLNRLVTSAKDFNSFQLGDILSGVKLPQILESLGRIDVKGGFTGYLHEFDASAEIFSQTGGLKADVVSKRDDKSRKVSYRGRIDSDDLNVGVLLSQSMLGSTGIHAQFDVTPGKLSDMKAELLAQLDNFYLNGNNYNSISLDADLDLGTINAQCDVFDEAIMMNLNCNLDLLNGKDLKLQAEINDANLKKINFFSFEDTTVELSTSLFAHIHNFDPDSIRGVVDLQTTWFKTSEKDYFVDYLNMKIEDEKLVLNSDLLDFKLDGKFVLSSLIEDIRHVNLMYVPEFDLLKPVEQRTAVHDTVDLNYRMASNLAFSIFVKDISLFKHLFSLDMDISSNTAIEGKLDSTELFFLKLNSDYFRFGSISINSLSSSVKLKDKDVSAYFSADRLNLSDSLVLYSPAMDITFDKTDMNLLARFGPTDGNGILGRLNLRAFFTESGLQLSFKDSYVDLAGARIRFNDNHLINYFNDKLSLINFSIVNGNESIVVNGDVSKNPNDKLTIAFKNINIADFNPLLASTGLKLEGRLNEKVVLNDVLSDMSLTSNLVVDGLVVNEVPLGKAWFNVSNVLSRKVFSADIKMLYNMGETGQTIPLSIRGTISPYDKANNLDLLLTMDRFDIKIIKNYIASLSSDIGGTLSTDGLRISGTFKQPDISGILKAENAHLKVNMLNTVYYFSDSIIMNNNVFTFKDFVMNDAQNNKIRIDGSVSHENFSDFDIKLKAVADKLKILDTEANSEQIYYGTAYASAIVNLYGNLDYLNIEVGARTEKGTVLTVPVSSKTSASENSFITFVPPYFAGDSVQVLKKRNETSMGYNITVDLNVNSNAQLFIPMDFAQLKGDLSAAGNGDLRIEINSDGLFSMLGTVTVDNGAFKMSVMDMVTKSFDIEKGGTLTWSGNPAEGMLDLQAVYKTKASLAPILGQEYSKAVDVHSIIHLTGEMMNPQPKFDIRLPNTDAGTVERLFMNIDRNDEKAMLEQTVSLLFVHQFYSSGGNYESSVVETGISSAFEAAFGQISGMLTDLIRVVDVDMNYSRGIDGNSDQVDLNVSKEYGRIVINVNSSFDTRNNVSANETNAIIGDAYVEYKMTENFRVRVFNRSNANDFTKYNIAPFTQGIGLFYSRQYDTFSDIFVRKKKAKEDGSSQNGKREN